MLLNNIISFVFWGAEEAAQGADWIAAWKTILEGLGWQPTGSENLQDWLSNQAEDSG